MFSKSFISRLGIIRQCWIAVYGLLVSVFIFQGAFAADRKAPTIHLNKLWQIGADESIDAPIFGLITDLCIDGDGNLYIVDQQQSQISIFNKDGEFLRNIGQEGDGPGEFRRPYRIFITPTGEVCVLASRFGYISRFSQLGEYLGDIAVPADSTGVVPIFRDIKESESGVIAYGLVRQNSQFVLPGERVEEHRIDLINSDAQVVTPYFSVGHSGDDAHPTWNERVRALDQRWDVAADGRVFVATDFLNYEVTLYGADGEVESVLSHDYKHRKRSRDETQAVYDWATINPHGNLPGTEFQIEDYDKDIMALYCRSSGDLWVLTSRGVYDRPENSAGVFDVFDQGLHYDHSVVLVGDGDPEYDRYVFSGNRLYVIKCFKSAVAAMVGGGQDTRFSEACTEPMSVICYEIGPSN